MKPLHRIFLATVLVSTGASLILPCCAEEAITSEEGALLGYADTPTLPDSGWLVHDSKRPYPREVKPGASATEAPSDAIVLFDGSSLSSWVTIEKEEQKPIDPTWIIKDGYVECAPKTGDLQTKASFGDCQLHIEFASPEVVDADSQDRGNSGVFFMGRYEMQILDSFENATYADGHCGSIYGQYPPLVNASKAPGVWQSYDIIFEAPRFEDDGSVKSPAYITVLHNGVLLHHRKAYLGPSVWRDVPKYQKHAPELPLSLQDHRNNIRYRNIWVRRLNFDENDFKKEAETEQAN